MIEPFDLIDLSVPLEHQSASEPVPGSIHYVKHEDEGLKQMQNFFGITHAVHVNQNPRFSFGRPQRICSVQITVKLLLLHIFRKFHQRNSTN